jgi:hypothetical protein
LVRLPEVRDLAKAVLDVDPTARHCDVEPMLLEGSLANGIGREDSIGMVVRRVAIEVERLALTVYLP